MKHYEYKGGCHCKDVQYTLKLTKPLDSFQVTSCNCSICDKTGYLHIFIDKAAMKLITPWKNLQKYQFNKKFAEHYFCKRCGIKSFYQPRSHPHQWSINARCVENYDFSSTAIRQFNGKKWQANVKQIT